MQLNITLPNPPSDEQQLGLTLKPGDSITIIATKGNPYVSYLGVWYAIPEDGEQLQRLLK